MLVELLTRKKPIVENENGEKRNLSNYFLSVMRERALEEIVDDQVLVEASNEEIMSLARLAQECLNLRREARPSHDRRGGEAAAPEPEGTPCWSEKRQEVRPPCEAEQGGLGRRGGVPVAGQDGTRQYSLEQEFASPCTSRAR
jgi:hypothetical protein